MISKENYVAIGPSWCMALTILFVGLKLTNQINWSWWWVLSPVWLPVAAALSFIVTLVCVVGVVSIVEKRDTAGN